MLHFSKGSEIAFKSPESHEAAMCGTLNVFLVVLVIFITILSVEATTFKFKVQPFSLARPLLFVPKQLKIIPSVVALSLSLSLSPTFAEEEIQSPKPLTTSVRVVSLTTTDSQQNVKSVDDPKNYRESLEKEKGKQKKMEKSKSQRSKDLCESLGRGC